MIRNGKGYPKVAILILNYNGWEYAIKCLESAYRITYPNFEVLLVDNGSVDNSILKIKDWAEGKITVESNFVTVKNNSLKWIEEMFYDETCASFRLCKTDNIRATLHTQHKLSILRIDENCGFAKGNNIGIEYILKDAETSYILLLSNDTIVDTECLNELVKAAETDKIIGMIQPKILTIDNPRIIDSTGHVFRFGKIADRGSGEIDNGQYDEKLDIIGACAGACLYKRTLLEDIGLFDANFFMYYEDAELSWRAFKQGWKGRFAPSAIVYHKVRGSSKTNNKLSDIMNDMALRNMAITVNRHGTLYQRFLTSMPILYTGIKSNIGKRLGRNNRGSKPYFFALKQLWISEKHI